MKRVVLVGSFILLTFLYACGPSLGAPIPPMIGTAVAHTQTATMWTPTLTPTLSPDMTRIKQLINEGFRTDELEMTLDARYTVNDAWFPYLSNSSSRIFHLDIHCECAINSHCCTPERTFVVTMNAMKNHAEDIIAQVPENIVRVDVTCHNSSGTIGAMGASWTEVKRYLLEEISGNELGWSVTPNPAP